MTPATFALLIRILFPFPLIFLWLRNRSKTKKCEQSGAEIQLKLDGLIKKYSPATSLEDEISRLEAEVADTGLKHKRYVPNILKKDNCSTSCGKKLLCMMKSYRLPNWGSMNRILTLEIAQLSRLLSRTLEPSRRQWYWPKKRQFALPIGQ